MRDQTTQEGAHALDNFSFGTIRIDGSTSNHDVVIDRGRARKRKEGPSKQFSCASGHRLNKGYGSFEVTLAFSIWLYWTGFFGPTRAQFNAGRQGKVSP